LFFDRGREQPSAANSRHRAAKAICALCPILAQCRLVGRADPSLEGIWGGETKQERRAARSRGEHKISPESLGNPSGRLRIQQAQRYAQRAGIPAAANRLAIPSATLERLLALHGLSRQPGIVPVVLAEEGCRAGG
jgi:hypothetical protein